MRSVYTLQVRIDFGATNFHVVSKSMFHALAFLFEPIHEHDWDFYAVGKIKDNLVQQQKMCYMIQNYGDILLKTNILKTKQAVITSNKSSIRHQ